MSREKAVLLEEELAALIYGYHQKEEEHQQQIQNLIRKQEEELKNAGQQIEKLRVEITQLYLAASEEKRRTSVNLTHLTESENR